MNDYRNWPTPDPEPWAAVWPTAVGSKDCRRLCRQDGLDFYCIHLIEAGRLRVESLPDYAADLGPGAMFTIFPQRRHGHWRCDPDDDNCTVYWAKLAGSRIAEFIAAMGMTPECPAAAAQRPAAVRRGFQQLMAMAHNHRRRTNLEAVSVLHEMLAGCDHREVKPPARSLVARAVELMEHEVDRGLNVEQISRAFNVSRSSLFLHFKRELGRSPVEVLIATRLARACKLLRETDWPIRRVATASGYSDVVYFSHQFRREKGVSPGVWRRRAVS